VDSPPFALLPNCFYIKRHITCKGKSSSGLSAFSRATSPDLACLKVQSQCLKCRKIRTPGKPRSFSALARGKVYELEERNSACTVGRCIGNAKGNFHLIPSLRAYFHTIPLAFLMFPLAARAQSKITPIAEIELHTHAEWRVNAQIEFDPAGRLLILYRDKFGMRQIGNWHLMRLTGPFSRELKREEIDFSIPQEPVDPESTRRWDSFSARLLLSPDGSRAYAVFEGSVVAAKSGPPPSGAVRNVSVDTFSSLISFDLRAFRLSASADVTQHPNNLAADQIITKGHLLLLYSTDTDWKIVILDESLHEVQRVNFSAAPLEKSGRSFCHLRPDLKVECPMHGQGDLLLGPESVIQLADSTCKMRPGSSAFGIGKDETVKDYIIEADHLCTRDESGKEELVSADLLPRCRQGWGVSAISPDRHSALTSCVLMDTFLDTFSYISKANLQLIDVPALAVRTTIPLSGRHRFALAVFHRSEASTIAVIEDGTRLLVYAVAD
jgi:hypothetical protein